MKFLLILLFLSQSFPAECQIFVSKKYEDSVNNSEKNHIGEAFRSFNVEDINARHFTNEELNGKITLINFWFESCQPCQAEFGALNNIFERFHTKKNFRFISFTFDDLSTINKVIEKYHLKFSVIQISKKECYRLNCFSGFPTTIIIDKAAKISFFKSGGNLDSLSAAKDINDTILPKLIEMLREN
ncbi:MAG: TlpA disulfide reductase family protein [Ginsengibacter sp.]